jgi:hypothetical protein
MAFVTNYKLKRVLGNIDLNFSNDPIARYIKEKYYYLPNKEVNLLSVYYQFIKNPEGFIENGHLKWVDTGKNAIEIKPAYHKSNECRALNKRFDNVILPSTIQSDNSLLSEARGIAERLGLYKFGEKTEDELQRFVVICMEELNHKHLNLGLKNDDFKIVHNKKNGGASFYSNLTLNEIKTELEKIISLSKEYFGFSESKYLVLPNDFFKKPFSYPEKLQKHNRLQVLERHKNYMSIIADTQTLYNNHTEYCTDDEVIQICVEITTQFTKPTVSTIENEMLKNTDKTEFSKSVLEILGFKSCQSNDCIGQQLSQTEKEYIEKFQIKI